MLQLQGYVYTTHLPGRKLEFKLESLQKNLLEREHRWVLHPQWVLLIMMLKFTIMIDTMTIIWLHRYWLCFVIRIPKLSRPGEPQALV